MRENQKNPGDSSGALRSATRLPSFAEWARSQRICPDCGMSTEADGRELHPCDPAGWYGPAIPAWLSRMPEGMSIEPRPGDQS